MSAHQIPQILQQRVALLYMTGLSITSVARELNIGRTSCWNALRRRSLARDNTSIPRLVDHTFFDTIDTEAKAYWLGFLTADGHVNDRSVRLQLANKDTAHIHLFAKALGSTHSISSSGGKSQIAISSRKLATSLQLLGFDTNKTETAHPVTLAPQLERHYWRGLVDGDGSVSWLTSTRHRGGRMAWVRLVGTAKIVDGFTAFVNKTINIYVKRQKHSSIWVVDYRCKSAKRVAKLLYASATIALPRKQGTARKMWNGA